MNVDRKILAAAVIGAAVLVAAAAGVLMIGRKRPVPSVKEPTVPAAVITVPQPKISDEIIHRGQTLSDILKRYHFSAGDIDRLKQSVKPVFNLNRIVAGRRMRLIQDPDGRVTSIEYPIDEKRYLIVTRAGDAFAGEIRDLPYETRVAFIQGTIENNPIQAFVERDEKQLLAIRMTDLFAWDIDFYTELRAGDAFRMVYEKKFLEGRFVDYGEILAADFVCQGKRFQAYRYEYPDTKKSDHFDREGKSIRKEFLRSPLPYARITSRFSFSRLHPVRKVFMAHFGVDYGAPVGTPVQATADGVVLSAGWNGASGRMVRIRHKNSYETVYLHLNQIYVKEGDRVTGGSTIIGTVGSSGESTGPHLDYRITQGGNYVNPLSWKFQPVAPLRLEFKSAFDKEVEMYDLLLEGPYLFTAR